MTRTLLLALGTVLALTSCRATGRIKAETEGDIVGTRTAGAATYNQIIEEGVQKLLASHSAQAQGTERLTLAVMGIDNRGSEELGDWAGQLYEEIATSINASGRYRTVSQRMIDRALQVTNQRQEDLLLPAGRRKFISILEAESNPVQLLLFPKITTGTTDAGRKSQRDYLLTLELIDVTTGWDDRFSSKVRKEYREGR